MKTIKDEVLDNLADEQLLDKLADRLNECASIESMGISLEDIYAILKTTENEGE